MSRIARLSACSVIALSIAAPAKADLTAAEVWESLESLMQGFGYTVSATEASTSNGLDVTDLVMEIAIPEEDGSVTVSMDAISFIENGDGSVQVVLPESSPIAIDAAPENDDAVSMVLDYTHSGFDIVVSGEIDNAVYTYSGDSIGLSLSELIVDGETLGRDVARIDLLLSDVSGTTTYQNTGDVKLAQDMNVSSATYDLAFNDPEGDASAVFSGSMDTVVVNSATTMPEGFDASDPQSIANGFDASGSLSYANGQMEFSASEFGDTTSGNTRTGTAALEFAMSGPNIQYALESTDQEISLAGGEIPVPVNVSMAKSAFNIAAPMASADAPQDMAFGVTLGGFEMSDLLWNMVDPGAALPRDPATIILDLTGKVTPFINMLDPASVAQLEATGGMPGELNALSLNNLTIEAAGAKLGGIGSFTFDNTDIETFGGFPRPTGGVDLTIDGANGLIDKLIAMGLLTNEDAMGARMMMSMFAVPGEGPDNLTSSIQVNEQGHVLANGMRIQ